MSDDRDELLRQAMKNDYVMICAKAAKMADAIHLRFIPDFRKLSALTGMPASVLRQAVTALEGKQ